MAVCIKDQIQNMNLVIGCTIGCSYCYARNNVRRFHMTEDFSRPEYFPGKLKLMDRKRPRNLLLTGMSDFSDWDPEWRGEVFARIGQNPQHQYIFLTKRPEKVRFSTELDNVWFGVTVTSEKEKGRIKATALNLCLTTSEKWTLPGLSGSWSVRKPDAGRENRSQSRNGFGI